MIVDSKHILYRFLKEEYDILNKQYGEKLNVQVSTTYPQTKTFEQYGPTNASITIERTSVPEEERFISDAFDGEDVQIGRAHV